jgi:hypothetical protein
MTKKRESRMKPFQIWLPAFDPAIGLSKTLRDLQRAQAAWRGETTVWLIPRLDKPRRWITPGNDFSVELALPAEGLNRIDIYHVGENGYLWGNNLRLGSPEVGGLLETWLNLIDDETHRFRLGLVTEEARMVLPRFEGNRLCYSRAKVKVDPMNVLPADLLFGPSPPELPPTPPPGTVPSVSPSEESLDYSGSLEQVGWLQLDERRRTPVFESTRIPGLRTVLYHDRWPEPLTHLFPYGGGLDAIRLWVTTREVARRSHSDWQGALNQAQVEGSRFFVNGMTPRRDLWLLPLIIERGVDAALFELERKFNLPFAHYDEAVASSAFVELVRERVPIQRVLGVQGLFWWLLSERLQEGERFTCCERCGGLLRGSRTKMFCGPRENRKCYASRRAASKRRERNRAKGRPNAAS